MITPAWCLSACWHSYISHPPSDHTHVWTGLHFDSIWSYEVLWLHLARLWCQCIDKIHPPKSIHTCKVFKSGSCFNTRLYKHILPHTHTQYQGEHSTSQNAAGKKCLDLCKNTKTSLTNEIAADSINCKSLTLFFSCINSSVTLSSERFLSFFVQLWSQHASWSAIFISRHMSDWLIDTIHLSKLTCRCWTDD